MRNEWILTLGASVAKHVGMPDVGGDGPGPFSLGDPDRIQALLSGAGLTDISVDPLTEPLRLGSDPGDVIGYAQEVGLVQDLLGDIEQHTREVVFDDMRSAVAEFHGEQGVWLGAAAWLVTGRRATRE